MKLKQYLNEAKKKTPKKWVADFMENMFDNREHTHLTWKEFFERAVDGAYYWSEDLYDSKKDNHVEIDAFRDRIRKVSSSGFSKDKKFFNTQYKD